MARPGKSDREREQEKFIEYAEKYLNINEKSLNVEKQRLALWSKMAAIDPNFAKVKDPFKNSETVQDYLNEYKAVLEVQREIRKEKEAEYKLDEKERKEREKFNQQLSKFNDFTRNQGKISTKQSTAQYNLGIAEDFKDIITERVVKKYNNEGIADRAHYKQMQNEIIERTNKALEHKGITDSYEKLQVAANSIDVGGKALQEVGNLFKSILNSALQLVDEGIDRQVKIYEDTFHDVSTRLGITRSDYFNFQLNTKDKIFANNLQYSMSVSENQTMLNSLANLGMSREDALYRAFDNVVTQKIVPYLDTTTLNFNLLNNRVNGDFVKQIRGINAYNADIAGNNYLTKEILEKMIDLVQPMSDESIQNLAKDTANYSAAMNYLMSEEGGNLSYDQAMDVYNTIYKSQNYASQMLRGSTFEKLFQIGIQEKNIDLEDLSQLPLAAGNYFGTGSTLSFGPGYGGSAEANLLQNTVGEAVGMSRSQWYAVNKFFGAGNTESSFNKMFTENAFDLEEYTDGEFTKLINNETTTSTNMQRYLTENISTPLATIKQQIGGFGEGILDGIDTIIKTLIGGAFSNIITSALGIDGISGGFKSFLAEGGGIAIGSFAAATIPFLASTISQGIAENKKSQALINASSYADELNSVSEIGDVTSASVIHSYADQLTSNGKGFGAKLGNVLTAFTQGLDIVDKATILMGKDPISVNKAIWDEATAGTSLKHETLRYMMIAFANSMLNAGNNSSIISQVLGSGINIDGIKTEAHLLYNKDPNNFLKNLKNAGNNLTYNALGPNGKRGNNYNFTIEDMKKWGTFRQGLATVPYDGYGAILHAGETVLTASTTAALNSLVMEYRESRNTNYRIDAAIQEQTAQLVAKIDEVINAMGSINFGNSSSNSPSEKLRNSFKTLTSPLAFQG